MKERIKSKKFYQKYALLLFLLPLIAKGDSGDLIEYNFQESISLDVIQTGLIIAGGGLGFSPPEFIETLPLPNKVI